MSIAALLTIDKMWQQTKCSSTDEWKKKMWYVHTHTHSRILLSQKKNEILKLATVWMGLEGTTLGEISQTEKDKYGMLSFICGI